MYVLLIADDEALERRALRTVVEQTVGELVTVEEAENGLVALQKARELKPDILLLDIKMPRMSGIEVAREVKGLLPDCQIILISGYTYFNYAREAVAIGIQDFLVKPVENEALVSALETGLGNLERNRAAGGDDSRMAHLSLCLEREFVSSFALRQIREPHLSDYLDTLGIGGAYCLGFLLEPSGQEGLLSELQESEARSLANRSFAEDRVLLAVVGRHAYGILFLKTHRSRLVLAEQFRDFASSLEPVFGSSFRICGGSLKSSAAHLFESFDEARRMACAKTGDVALAVPGEELRSGVPLDLDKEFMLGEKLMQGQRDQCLVLLEDLYRQIEQNSQNLSELKARVTNLLVVLGRRMTRGMIYKDCLSFRYQVDSLSRKDEIKAYVFDQLQQMLQQVEIYYTRESREWKSAITRYLSQNFCKETTLEEMASLVGFSASYLSRIFKKEFGMNFCSYVNHLRIEEAKRLLAAGELSIKEISYHLGFSDANYFARVFKKETGQSASQYQRAAELAGKNCEGMTNLS